MVIKKVNSEHYKWGDNCDGWRLVDTEGLSVIEEMMPPQTSEIRHYHASSQQFFFILAGIATFELEGKMYNIQVGEGFYIPPLAKHCVYNYGTEGLHFLVISQPTTRGDRY